MEKYGRWREIWEKKGQSCKKKDINLIDLLYLDGFDRIGKFNEDTWMRLVDSISKELNLSPGKSLLEIGCGSGAMLLPLSQRNIKVAGIDYSASLINIAKLVIPDMIAIVSEADKLPFRDNKFDFVMSNSVFQYFSNKNYAKNVLNEMVRVVSKNEGKLLILDVPDISKEGLSEDFRKNIMNKSTYKKLYNGLYHTYYPKDWFKSYALEEGLKFKIFDQSIEGYDNSPYRFNVLFEVCR